MQPSCLSSASYSRPLTIEQKMAEVFEADKTRSFVIVNRAVLNCLKAHNLSLQEIETELRNRNCWTFLIAKKQTASMPANLIFQTVTGTPTTYYCCFCTRDRRFVAQELREYSSSYEDNFAKLADAGFPVVKLPSSQAQ